jgi:MFS transporter, DHA1 family, multidrug resistance protein
LSTTRLIVLMAMLTGMGQLPVGLVVPSMPAIADYFVASDDRVKLTFSLFILTVACAQLVVGPLSDHFGRKICIQVGNVVFLLSSLLCAFAPSLGILIAARVAQGVGACVPVVVSRAVVRDVHSGEEAARALAAIGMVMAVAPALGPTLGGFIQVTVGWRGVFAVLAGLGLVAVVLTQRQLVETLPVSRRQPFRIGRIVSVYLSLLRDRLFMAYSLAVLFSLSGLGAYLAGAPFIFIRLLEIPEPVFGMFSIANVGSFAVGSAIASRFTGKAFTMQAMIVIGGAMNALGGGLLLLLILAGELSVVTIMGPTVVFFVGMGILVPNAMAAAINRYPDHAGLASAMLGFLQFGGWGGAGLAVGLLGGEVSLAFASVFAFVGLATPVTYVLLGGWPEKFRP